MDECEPLSHGITLTQYVCDTEGCGKVFFDAGKLRKHTQTHAERKYPCQYPNCGSTSRPEP